MPEKWHIVHTHRDTIITKKYQQQEDISNKKNETKY